MIRMIRRLGMTVGLVAFSVGASAGTPKNIVFILSDDHRYDFMGFHPDSPEFLETPSLDRMAKEGVHFANAFVTTSLCSPSRASILTGQYMHTHQIVDNQRPPPEGTRFFPEYLQEAGYDTAYIGKWHMGHDNDEARPGFTHWASFKGQGVYEDPEFNINGERKIFKGYNADVTADLALAWLDGQQEKTKPFCLYVGFKAVHYPFQPAKRHHGRYQDKAIDYPETMALTEENYRTQSRWIRDRRYGIHGIDHMQTGPLDKDPVPDFDDLYWRFCETVHGLDENVGRIMSFLENHGFLEDTLVVYMGDNGFALGEHGFYDKRDAFEESIRVPLLAWGAGIAEGGTTVSNMVLNIDVAPTLLDVAGVTVPANQPQMEGRSFLPALGGEVLSDWREHMLYEYHWEWNFPAQPTTLAIRNDRYKYVYYHGVWDRNGFYDLQTDPHERHNLIDIPAFKEHAMALRTQLFTELEAANGLTMPLRPPKGDPFHDRKLER